MANRTPHGHGVMVFREGDHEVARDAGAFIDGVREGHGLATSDDELAWPGAWRNDEARGFALLEARDGARLEGEIAPDENGAPKHLNGWVWNAPGARVRKGERHGAMAPALPSPQAVGG